MEPKKLKETDDIVVGGKKQVRKLSNYARGTLFPERVYNPNLVEVYKYIQYFIDKKTTQLL